MIKRASDRILDLRGVISPFAILKVESAFRELRQQECIEILLSDAAFIKDLLKVLPKATTEVIINSSSCKVKLKKEKNQD